MIIIVSRFLKDKGHNTFPITSAPTLRKENPKFVPHFIAIKDFWNKFNQATHRLILLSQNPKLGLPALSDELRQKLHQQSRLIF